MTYSILDITTLVCPMTFVRSKLAVEKLPPGGELEIRLNPGEPLENVPRSLVEHGYEVISLHPDRNVAGEGGRVVYRLRVRRPG